MPDATGEMPEVPEEVGVRKDLIPGYSIGKGIRTERKDDEYPGAGTYQKLPTAFPWSNIDR